MPPDAEPVIAKLSSDGKLSTADGGEAICWPDEYFIFFAKTPSSAGTPIP